MSTDDKTIDIDTIDALKEIVALTKQAQEIYSNLGRDTVTVRLTERMLGMMSCLAAIQLLVKHQAAGDDVKAGVKLDPASLKFAERAIQAVIAQESGRIAEILAGMVSVDKVMAAVNGDSASNH